jgi:transposase-like protein
MKHTYRTRKTPEQLQRLVAQFNQSTLSSVEFCKTHGLAYSSFYKWCKKYNATESVPGKNLLPSPMAQFIDLQALAAAHNGTWSIVLKLGNGVELLLSQA